MLSNFGVIFVFLLAALVLVGAAVVTAWLVRPSHPSKVKLMNYESGMVPEGTPWILFNTRFYMVALAYIIFDVELVLLFPWATVFKGLGWYAFWGMAIFVFILFLGLFYDWAKGYLDWDKPKPYIPQLKDFTDMKDFTDTDMKFISARPLSESEILEMRKQPVSWSGTYDEFHSQLKSGRLFDGI
ncbi:MAG: NADH-quinone oxidoreductase subunit A [Ignavibacteria bacterium]|jgi:NADH-quinone oxidoreductase subunit A|nr:NADH-quinone oxidoreductase subunit A [Ignavibacteria bacterium]